MLRSRHSRLLGLIAVFLALFAQLSAGAMVMPYDPADAQIEQLAALAGLDPASVLCHTGDSGQPHHQSDCDICPLCAAIAVPVAILVPGAELPPPAPIPAALPTTRQSPRAPPTLSLAAAYPRGPPSLVQI